MPLYHFAVQDGVRVNDPTGTMFDNDVLAITHGAQIARELMAGGLSEVSAWNIEIADGLRVVASIPFTTVQ